MPDDQSSIFERAFDLFLRRGGFSRPCVTEEIERQYLQNPKRKPPVCPHGLTPLTCSICYFNEGWNYQ